MISIIIPVFNEAECIADTYQQLCEALTPHESFEFLFIDDGSSDNSLQILKKLSVTDRRVRIISFSRNFGHQVAVSAGIDFAIGDAAVVIDADLQDPPAVIPQLIEKWKQGYQVVYAVRTQRKESYLLRLLYKIFYRLMRKFSYLDIPLDSGDFALIDRIVINALKTLPERNRFIRGLRVWVGYKHIGIPYERAARLKGVSKYSILKLIRLAYDGIFSFSFVPLRVLTWLGFFISCTAFVSIFIVLYLRLFTTSSIPGFASLAILILFFGGVQILSLGVVGEYIARIFDEVKQRPLYIVKENINNMHSI